jgi:formylglycine-generating enzyme required for sulfatase activity
MKKLFILILLLALVGCNTTPETTPAPTPTKVAENSTWEPVIETVGEFEMVLVPAGCFMMGNEAGRRDERPAHEVCFDAPFWIDRYEVTNAQYGEQGNFPGEDRPRENLTWHEAQAFCATRGGRLPTEAEWEYAARGPSNLYYPWGDELVGENLVFDQNANGETAPVGSRPGGVSWVGTNDQAGNVWEWTLSEYARYPYEAHDGRNNLDSFETDRVFRGGTGSYINFGASATARFHREADSRDWFIGFRCMRDSL